MTSASGSSGIGRSWFIIPSIIIVIIAIIVPLLSLKYHSYPTHESIHSFGDAFGNAVGDVLGETPLGDALGDAIGDIIGDVVTDLLDGDEDEDSDTATSGGGRSLCSLSDEEFATDHALQTMTFDIGYGPQEMQVYVQPDVSTFYTNSNNDSNEQPAHHHRERKQPKHEGWAAKFVNISTRTVRLFWCPNHGGPCSPMSVIRPFDSAGTASFPHHTFHIEDDESREVVAKFVIDPPTSVYYYDAITVSDNVDETLVNVNKLTLYEQQAYKAHIDSRKFSEYYYQFTGRQYLSFYPRTPPIHRLWPANYFGQEHWVTSRETHFITNPPLVELTSIDEFGSERILQDNDARLLSNYREQKDNETNYLNMTLKVISCAPRAFEINNFLSPAEVDHIMYLTTGLNLVRSTTAGGTERFNADEELERDHTKDTRTSLNTWVYREKDAIMDTIYRRAADVLRIDEALLRPRSVDEYPQMDNNTRSLAEALQLVHYDVGQEYTAHHDFGYAKYNNEKKQQPARFATLLLYLNEPEEGGATQFPRWANAETNEGLNVEPKRGKAVLFYSQLPDGNMDDLSQHAALPVRVGEKWLMNLW